jgi:hypothetical protein
VLGIKPLNHIEHATQIIAEATALLEEFDNINVPNYQHSPGSLPE